MKSNTFLSIIYLTFFLGYLITYIEGKNYANAQIIPDQTLGQESSIINSIDDLKKQIEGGAIRGSNLFHSFQEFNVGEGKSVYFINPNGIENILTRITGNNPSNILGRLGVDGGANLFLMNPQGIVFGPNASLDIRGSFIATTADEIRLGENGVFSATASQTSNLLSVAPSALFSNQLESQVTGTITNQSTQQEVGLELEGQTLALVAGNVVVDRGLITAPEGRVELGGVGNNSIVRLNPIEKGYELDYSEVENFQDVSLKSTIINTQGGEGGGDIVIRGRNVAIAEQSAIIGSTQGSEPGGNIAINSSETIQIISSNIFTDVSAEATANGGKIDIQTQNLTVGDGSVIAGETFGVGNAGNLTIRATEIEASGTRLNPEGEVINNFIATGVGQTGTGEGGTLTIETQRLTLQDGTQIDASTSGEGNGGNIDIQTQDLIIRDGSAITAQTFGVGNAGNLTIRATDIEASGTRVDSEGQVLTNFIAAGVQQGGTGDSGTLTIETQRLSLQDGSQIDASTSGDGQAGSLIVQAETIELIGITEDGLTSGLFATVQDEATGNGGNLNIETQSLTIRDGALVGVLTRGAGNAGELNIKAQKIEVIGRSDQNFPSTISATVRADEEIRASGNGGEIFIQTDSLTILDGGIVEAITQGDGPAGKISIQANDNITISGFNSVSGNSSAITATTESGATKPGGNIEITTPILNIDNGAVITARSSSNSDGGNINLDVNTLNLTTGGQVLTSSLNSGNAGTIEVNARDRIYISGVDSNFNSRQERITMREEQLDTNSAESAIASRARNDSDAGSVTLNSPLLKIEDQGIVSVSSFGEGVAGSLNVNAPSIELDNGSLRAETSAGDQGNITLNSSNISLQNNSQITTSARGTATGGNITINTQFLLGKNNSQINASAIQGQGGNISIFAEGIFFDNSSQITASSALGIDGTVDINTQVDPTQGVVALSPQVVDASSIVAQNLCLASESRIANSSFVITGRGGLPPNPNQPLTVLRGVVDWDTGNQKVISESKQPTVVVYKRTENKKLPEISQATGWVMTEVGNILLTSTSPNTNTDSLQLIHPGCYVLEKRE
ncbi:MAG: filamentous hemagglutinin N-terminal domain-containing protein [Trichodesmium sp.]